MLEKKSNNLQKHDNFNILNSWQTQLDYRFWTKNGYESKAEEARDAKIASITSAFQKAACVNATNDRSGKCKKQENP